MNSKTILSVGAGTVLMVGCASSGVKNPSGVPVTQMNADERGFVAGTGVESQDLVAVTDKMARSILGIPQIARAQGVPCVVLDPVKNETRFPINKDIFLTRIRVQLNSKAAGKVSFLARDRMEARQKRHLARGLAVQLHADAREENVLVDGKAGLVFNRIKHHAGNALRARD